MSDVRSPLNLSLHLQAKQKCVGKSRMNSMLSGRSCPPVLMIVHMATKDDSPCVEIEIRWIVLRDMKVSHILPSIVMHPAWTLMILVNWAMPPFALSCLPTQMISRFTQMMWPNRWYTDDISDGQLPRVIVSYTKLPWTGNTIQKCLFTL